MGSHPDVVSMVRSLKNIEILKSYLFLIWSEWGSLWNGGFDIICVSIREDFGGIEMYPCRADLVERLDHVLGQMNRGLEHLRQSKPEFREFDFQIGKNQYGKLRGILLEEDRKTLEVLTRTYFRLIVHFDILTPLDVRRVPLDICVRAPSPVSVVDHPRWSPYSPSPHYLYVGLDFSHAFVIRFVFKLPTSLQLLPFLHVVRCVGVFD